MSKMIAFIFCIFVYIESINCENLDNQAEYYTRFDKAEPIPITDEEYQNVILDNNNFRTYNEKTWFIYFYK